MRFAGPTIREVSSPLIDDDLAPMLRGIIDLGPAAAAPQLESLDLIEMCQLRPEHLRPFAGHPTLRRATLGLCSDSKNAAASKLLGL